MPKDTHVGIGWKMLNFAQNQRTASLYDLQTLEALKWDRTGVVGR